MRWWYAITTDVDIVSRRPVDDNPVLAFNIFSVFSLGPIFSLMLSSIVTHTYAVHARAEVRAAIIPLRLPRTSFTYVPGMILSSASLACSVLLNEAPYQGEI